jgi:hypothetical protein
MALMEGLGLAWPPELVEGHTLKAFQKNNLPVVVVESTAILACLAAAWLLAAADHNLAFLAAACHLAAAFLVVAGRFHRESVLVSSVSDLATIPHMFFFVFFFFLGLVLVRSTRARQQAAPALAETHRLALVMACVVAAYHRLALVDALTCAAVAYRLALVDALTCAAVAARPESRHHDLLVCISACVAVAGRPESRRPLVYTLACAVAARPESRHHDLLVCISACVAVDSHMEQEADVAGSRMGDSVEGHGLCSGSLWRAVQAFCRKYPPMNCTLQYPRKSPSCSSSVRASTNRFI